MPLTKQYAEAKPTKATAARERSGAATSVAQRKGLNINGDGAAVTTATRPTAPTDFSRLPPVATTNAPAPLTPHDEGVLFENVLVAPQGKASTPQPPAERTARETTKPIDQATPVANDTPASTSSRTEQAKADPPTAKQEAGSAATAAASEAEGAGGTAVGLGVVEKDLALVAAKQKSHESVEVASASTERAADVTPEEAAGKSRGAHVESMAQQQPAPFNREQFKAQLRTKIQALQADDAKNIKEGDQAESINQAVKSGVAAEKQTAAGAIEQVATQTPAPGEPQPGEKLAPISEHKPPAVDATRAMPAPVPEERRSMSAESATLDATMAEAKVTPEQLTQSNEPEFQAAAAAREQAQSAASALPSQAQTAEANVLANARTDAAQTTQAGLAEMHEQRQSGLMESRTEQLGGKDKYEATRKRIALELGAIYEATQTAVADEFKALDASVENTFKLGAAAAKAKFYAFLGAKLLLYYASGAWMVDAFVGGKGKEAIFEDGRRDFLADMERVIDAVADVVERGLNRVVGIIQTGRDRLANAVKQYGPDDAAVAQEVAGGLSKMFSELEASVEEKKSTLIDSLAEKVAAAQRDVESTISFLRDPVGALIDMALDSLAGVIKIIMNMKNLLLSVFAKAAEAIDFIIADPIAFLGYLVAGVKQGVLGFLANIGTYLQKGLLDWLFGALAEAGIQMPEKFNLQGLLSIALQVLGLTWTNIRKRAVQIVGEPIVKTLETGSEIVLTLINKGASGLWEYVKEQAANLLDSLMAGFQSLVMESVIGAGVKWLIGLLNPASAFVKACLAIYDIVMFIVNRGQQIMSFVNAVLDSVLSIAKGDIAPAAKAVEAALAKSIPVAIGFLASLLGIGDLGAKIRKVIEQIQAPVNSLIDWLIKKAVGLVKSVGKMLGLGKEKKKENNDEISGVKLIALERVKDKTIHLTKFQDIQNALPSILNDLKPQGLENLYCIEDEDGGCEIRAQASPDISLLNFIPKSAGKSVQLTARISFENSNDTTEKPSENHVNQISNEIARRSKFQKLEKSGHSREIATINPGAFGGSVPGVMVALPLKNQAHLDIVSFNTTDNKTNKFQSHAEFQFCNFVDDFVIEKFAAINAIEIFISQSPCGDHCVGALDRLANSILAKRDAQPTTFTLTYSKIYKGSKKTPGTSAEDIARLEKHWKVSGPKAPTERELECSQ